ncbi:hypothetical protein M5D96_013646 [Drosophila gunungcola]|uniref:RING-type domain-containing protein n=1 Tax=Drosophila gunungcola TaxID=103775 RepID=A0A9P9YAZ2_9MUSC|nr:hypothetical protein M5D96_013646 [Drosophila gunungcola]
MEVSRRAADGIEPSQIIDLTREEKHLCDENGDIYVCPICYEPPVRKVITNCGHLFCQECLNTALQTNLRCPLCKTEVTSMQRIYT